MIADISSQQQEPEARKRKRGETREDGKVFWIYKRGNEWWITPEKFLEYKAKNADRAKKARAANPEKARANSRASHARNKDKEKAYYEANKERLQSKWREYFHQNKSWLQPRKVEWRKDNKEKLRPWVNEYARSRRNENPLVAVQGRISSRIRVALSKKGYGKNSVSVEILGCSWDDFMNHIESQFVNGMNWENRSDWNIDHIIPIACAKDESEILMLSHFSNLQPLWETDNKRKQDDLPENFVDLWNQLCKITGNELKMR